MNFNEEKGNLFDLDNNKYTYVHCISSDCVMGAGIAKEFVKKYKGIREWTKSRINNSWTNYPLCVPMIENKHTIVINLVTKDKYWNKPTYDSLKSTLIDMREFCIRHDIKYLAMPKIGCGLDGLEWKNVRKMIINLFEDIDINIEIRYL